MPTPRAYRLIATGLVVGFVALIVAIPACSPSAAPQTGPSRQEQENLGPDLFADVTSNSGIAFTYRNGEDANHYAIIESLGGGVALIDFDRDGRLDIFLVGGGYYDGKKVLGHSCKLYRNLGDFKFDDVSAKVGLAAVTFQYGHGAAAFDYDCDGWPDLLTTGYNRVVLLHNEPDGTGGRRFVDVTAKAKLTDAMWSSSAGWGDLDGDGFPELYVAHYGDWGFDTNHPTDCTYDGSKRDVCQPRRFKPLPHTLYRNNRDGTFTDISEKMNLRKDGRGMGVLFVDVNNDGRPDLCVANDTDDNFLYVNRGKPGEIVLEELGLLAGFARDDRGMPNGSMGIDAADYDRSGLAGLLVTNYENELPALSRNRCDPSRISFTYDTSRSGMAAIGGSYVSWGTAFFDYDLDGWEDVMIVNGHAIRYPTKIDRRQKPVLLQNHSGKFTQTTARGGAYFREPHNARGAAFGDLNNDGRIDVVVSHLNEPVVVLRNIAPTEERKWVGLQLEGVKNRDVTGARVVLETAGGRQTRFVKGGGSYASTNDPRLLFGLGTDDAVKSVTIHWPSGKVEQLAGVAPGNYWHATEGNPTARKLEEAKQ